MKKFLFLLFAFGIIGIIGCDKQTGPSATKKPVVPKASVAGPQTQSQDQHAQEVNQFAALVNSLANIAQPYANLPGTQNGNTWTYTETLSGYSITMTAVEETNGAVTWKMVVNGQEPGDTIIYNNWKAMEGSVSGDGKSGSWKIYNTNTTIVALQFDFSTNAAGSVTSDLTGYNEIGAVEATYKFINNTDGSGEAYFYEGTVLSLKFVWIANGSGTWWTYDANGTQTGTGVWS